MLLDDQLQFIVRAVCLGRRIFDNLQKSMSHLLAVHADRRHGAAAGAAGLAGDAVARCTSPGAGRLIRPARWPSRTNPAETRCVMQRPPRAPAPACSAAPHWPFALLQGAGALVVVMAAYGWGLQQMTEEQARALASARWWWLNLALILSNRSHHYCRCWLKSGNPTGHAYGSSLLRRPGCCCWSLPCQR